MVRGCEFSQSGVVSELCLMRGIVLEYFGKWKFSSPSAVDSDLVGVGQGLETII